jgi:hypothetical protein
MASRLEQRHASLESRLFEVPKRRVTDAARRLVDDALGAHRV